MVRLLEGVTEPAVLEELLLPRLGAEDWCWLFEVILHCSFFCFRGIERK